MSRGIIISVYDYLTRPEYVADEIDRLLKGSTTGVLVIARPSQE